MPQVNLISRSGSVAFMNVAASIRINELYIYVCTHGLSFLIERNETLEFMCNVACTVTFCLNDYSIWNMIGRTEINAGSTVVSTASGVGDRGSHRFVEFHRIGDANRCL